MRLLDLMLKRDAADLNLQQTIELYRVLVTTLPPQVFDVLDPSWRRDAIRLAHQGHITLPRNFTETRHE